MIGARLILEAEMSDSRFDDDVPMPEESTRWVWDFRAMRPGQSLFVPTGTVENGWADYRARQALYAATRRWRGKARWAWKHVDGGIRIWRLE